MAGLDLEKHIEREFLTMPLRPSTMTYYTVRTSILAAVQRETADFHGTVLDLGCGFMPYRSIVDSNPAVKRYVGMDLEHPTYYGDAKPDLNWDGREITADDESFDCVMATEFLEHCSEPGKVLAEIHRVLKPSGKFFATVPFIWNLHELPYDEYRYTPFSLERLLTNGGFRNIEIKALGGWNLAFAQMTGLWTGFSPMNRMVRKLLQILVFPFYVFLVKTDRVPDGFDSFNRSMYSGLSVTARR
jgi:SAM-dependent methyltransferase